MVVDQFKVTTTFPFCSLLSPKCESSCLVERKVFAVIPPKAEYSISEEGRTLNPSCSVCLGETAG
ncbi:winged helix-turn-helix transcriptional regulator (plasmid) [Rhizobium sp. YTU87027]